MQSSPTFRWKPFLPLLVLFFTFHVALAQYAVSSLPNPKTNDKHAYISNPDGIVSAGTVDEINALCRNIAARSGTEYAVVLVNDFEGEDIFEFALDVFNTWGIGKEGANNGLLLFIAKDRRAYRFVSGYGLEGIFPDVYLHRIGEKYLVPNFREGNYDAGVLAASKAIEQALLAPDVQNELARMMPEARPYVSVRNENFLFALSVIALYAGLYFWLHTASKKYKGTVKPKKGNGCTGWLVYLVLSVIASGFTLLFLMLFFAFFFQDMERLFQTSGIPYFLALCGSYMLLFKIYEIRGAIKRSYLDEENRLTALKRFQRDTLIPYVFTPLMLISFLQFRQRWSRSQARFAPPDASGNWRRMNRDEVALQEFKQQLNTGQLKEEYLSTKFYEVWINTVTAEKRVLGWDEKNTHTACPSCGFKTYKLRDSKVLKAATYSSTGLRKVFNKCANCKQQENLGTETIPKKTRSTSSGGGSSSGGSSGGSSSSGGGSFGGGSSGGGGAGGRW
ncbi:TPM domain-containing protein [Sphingobacterium oryzagri]|uniref:TPM domain-containing protein n=1 Tax=Sphingobacterium oryzagri TaxID=3025669 RepID=A0ABY7WFL3_9SPHI|nr:TPM domain-containing protein [Sphingobacterium sp. KACC 22765]WDF68419.1 TPM domain-containing protein [Sphingobacterium sp. KACC 22765]